MSINKLIINTLKPLNIPVDFQTYEGKEETYITFFCYNEQGERFADDTEIITGFYMQVDIWSKGNVEKLKESVINLLKQVGFKRKNGQDMYESDTKIFHKVLRFFYYVENKEEEE
ncbi:hypothetical protein FDA77_19185 [Clostridium botulinum]|uniref:hypothetical protein n=1 Tax=Clostridium botulinum TaxID=1491 RepID=UPI0013FA27D6|nr:hypothetical protein [Clostridium botulinum]MBY6888762.1 hypothetical protein [Clostridium botulinum]NFI47946.1 hypothetical protein [Clostridium botulinum]NFJ91952.1 hypothetical protein [Clostridium botulinum]HBJ2609724.1 hypothetical protein [Clostridium botulinum]HDI3120753.1 hypothetical protein [Clostridium botulinum]